MVSTRAETISVDHLTRATVANVLRAQGMPFEEVLEVLVADPVTVTRYLELHGERLEELAAEQRAALERVRWFLLESRDAIGA